MFCKCLSWFEAMRGRLIGPKNLGPNCWNFWRLFRLSVTVQKLIGLVVLKLSIKLYVGMYEAGNSPWNSIPPRGTDVGGVGCPWTIPLALFWDCKSSPSLYEIDHKCPCVLAMELFDVSGLSWLIKEINRLMFDVLT